MSRRAEERFDSVFKESEIPEDVPEAEIPETALDGGDVYLPRVLADLGLAPSGSAARRLIAQGGVKVNGEPPAGDKIPARELVGAVLQVGKRRFVRLRE
jgi:tyrosyl-tRNA synthetase